MSQINASIGEVRYCLLLGSFCTERAAGTAPRWNNMSGLLGWIVIVRIRFIVFDALPAARPLRLEPRPRSDFHDCVVFRRFADKGLCYSVLPIPSETEGRERERERESSFPQHNVEGLLFSWPWTCLSSLLNFLFLNPLGKTAAVVFLFFVLFS